MVCYTCGKKYTSRGGLFYHRGVVHGHANDTYEKIKNRQRQSKLLRNLQENRTEEKVNSSGCRVKRNLDVSSDKNRKNDKF